MQFRNSIGQCVMTVLLCGTIIIGNGCYDADFNEPTAPTTAEDAITVDPNLSLFEETVNKANLGGTLAGAGPFTVFTPDDAAFAASGISSATISAMSQTDAQTLVNYHTLPGSTSFANFPAGPNAIVNTVSGDSVFVTKNSSGVFINGWKINQPDITVSNGILHKTERVLIPPRGNIVETAQLMTGVLDSFAKAVTVATTGIGGDPSINPLLTSTRVTAFAPNNQAFTNYLTSLGITDIANIPKATLIAALKYHLVSGRTFSSDLTNGNLTMSAGGTTVINLTNGVGGGPTITGAGNAGSFSNIISLNIVARNGVIHVIDRVLLP